jgi:hypothetical protein
MVSFHDFRYGSEEMREGRAAHLYAGAISLGRSDRTEVGAGDEGENGSEGQVFTADAEEGRKVGVENAAELVVEGYMGSIHWLSVDTG